jgi:hypothetical protein
MRPVSSILVLLGALGCTAERVAQGQQCTFNDECAAGLLCAGGRCRTLCRSDRDCMNNWRCGPSGQADKRVCLEPGTPIPCLYPRDCAPSGVCGRDGFCRNQCAVDADCAQPGDTCDRALGLCRLHPCSAVQCDPKGAPLDAGNTSPTDAQHGGEGP